MIPEMTETQAIAVERLMRDAKADDIAVQAVAQYLGRESSEVAEYVVVNRTGRFDVVDDTPPSEDAFPRPTGQQIFDAKTTEQQDEMLGRDAAALVRAGIITLDDLHGKSNLDSEPDFITQKPLSAVT